jgi:hypothetical protein
MSFWATGNNPEERSSRVFPTRGEVGNEGKKKNLLVLTIALIKAINECEGSCLLTKGSTSNWAGIEFCQIAGFAVTFEWM